MNPWERTGFDTCKPHIPLIALFHVERTKGKGLAWHIQIWSFPNNRLRCPLPPELTPGLQGPSSSANWATRQRSLLAMPGGARSSLTVAFSSPSKPPVWHLSSHQGPYQGKDVVIGISEVDKLSPLSTPEVYDNRHSNYNFSWCLLFKVLACLFKQFYVGSLKDKEPPIISCVFLLLGSAT